MDPAKKKAREQEKALAVLSQLFAANGQQEIPKLEDIQSNEHPDDVRLEGEAVARFIENPQEFKVKKCKRCNSTFAANQLPVSFCSNACVIKHLAEIGIRWDPHRSPQERFGFWPAPLRVPPQFLAALRDTMTESDSHFLPEVNRERLLDLDQTSQHEPHQQLYPDEISEEDSVFDFD